MKKKLLIYYKVLLIIFYSSVPIIYIFTDLIIPGLEFSNLYGVYREIKGSLYNLHTSLQILFIFFFIYFAYKRYKEVGYLNKLRLINILIFTFLLILVIIVFQLILPLFGIWLFEKEIIFFFVIFILSIVYTIKRYFFGSVGYGIGKLLIGLLSAFISIFITNLLTYIYTKINYGEYSYWGLNDNSGFIKILIGIVLFQIFYKLFSEHILGKTKGEGLRQEIYKLQQNISYITDLVSLNHYLMHEIKKLFKVNYSEIILYNKKDKFEIQKYFENNSNEKIFINDIVFIEENTKKFNKEKIASEITKNSFLIFPIYEGKRNNIGFFTLGTKSFGDFYNTDEVEILKIFTFFLEYHLKYINSYEKIRDFSINLDKKVDEKTIEYNNLINKQKEFISMISHEIRSPISSAIFQADSIIDDLDSGEMNDEKLKEELEILNTLLMKTGDLTSKLFSIQYYDTQSIALYKEKINISNLLGTELDVYKHMNEDIDFINKIDKKMGFIEIDKIQFQQVIGNILTNAIKFVKKTKGIISIESFIKNGFLNIIIEDNGEGFDGIEVSNLFEKYSTGRGNSIGLGMGLYLCKRIIDMHNGSIEASLSEKLGGARFNIILPII